MEDGTNEICIIRKDITERRQCIAKGVGYVQE